MRRTSQFFGLFRLDISNALHLGLLYRTLSLVLTSILFFLEPQTPLLFKIGVVVILGISAWIISDLQRRYIHQTTILKAIILAETIGLTLLLIPTGGISSPFIWYALNPVLVAVCFLTPFFCWGALTFYLGSATFITARLSAIDNIGLIFVENAYIYLICALTIVLARLFSGYTKEILQVNRKLTDTNDKYRETLEHSISFYKLMNTISFENNPGKLASEINELLRKCTQSEASFFWLADCNMQNGHIVNTTNNPELEADLKAQWTTLREEKGTFTGEINYEHYQMKVIRTSNNIGVLGVQVTSAEEVKKSDYSFEFLAKLSEIMVERMYLDLMMDQKIVIEEQNRIANEIHDSVSQRLFGIVYALHSLQAISKDSTREELNQEYRFLSQSANTAIKELRAAIYRLSSVKNRETPFLVRLKKYLDDFARLCDIQIDYDITGDESYLPSDLQDKLHRIICEACGNAVRHGKCTKIDVKLSITDEMTLLMIQDDGIGFKSDNISTKKQQGIGLLNIQESVNAFYGTFSIDGIQGMGTIVHIEIPMTKFLKEQGVAG